MFDVFGQKPNKFNNSEFDENSGLNATDAFADKLEISKSSKSTFLQASNADKARSTFGQRPARTEDAFGQSPAKKGSVFNFNASSNKVVKNKLNNNKNNQQTENVQNSKDSSVFNQRTSMQRNQNIAGRKGNLSSNKQKANKTMMMVNIVKTSALYEKTKDGGYFIA